MAVSDVLLWPLKLLLHMLSRRRRRAHLNTTAAPLNTTAAPQDVVCRPVALAHSGLGILPFEIIFLIAEFLPIASAACFSLSCRQLSFIFGTRYTRDLRAPRSLSLGGYHSLTQKQSDHHDFLLQLVKGNPDYGACYNCMSLHSRSQAYKLRCSLRYFKDKREYLPWCYDQGTAITQGIHDDFNFIIFQWTMKVYRLGFWCDDLLQLLSYDSEPRITRDTYSASGPNFTQQQNALAKIIGGSLILRTQHIFWTPLEQDYIPLSTNVSAFFSTCIHSQRIQLNCRGYYGDILRDRVAHWEERGFYKSRSLHRCVYCLTEFRVDFQKIEGLGVAAFFTKWQDLGEGRWPADQKWTSHCRYESWHNPVLADYAGRSICADFEQDGNNFQFDSLLTSAKKKLMFVRLPPS